MRAPEAPRAPQPPRPEQPTTPRATASPHAEASARAEAAAITTPPTDGGEKTSYHPPSATDLFRSVVSTLDKPEPPSYDPDKPGRVPMPLLHDLAIPPDGADVRPDVQSEARTQYRNDVEYPDQVRHAITNETSEAQDPHLLIADPLPIPGDDVDRRKLTHHDTY